MIELILVRHGETVENSRGIIQGQTEGILSENGIEQNKLLANKLKNLNIDQAFTSPLQRAVKTAEQIIEFHNIDLIKDLRLIERDMGVLQGKEIPFSYNLNDYYEGMESLRGVFNRSKSFLSDLQKNYKHKRVLIVSHGITSLVLSAVINKTEMVDIHKESFLKNSTYTILNFGN